MARVEEDSELEREILQQLQHDPNSVPRYYLQWNNLLYRGRLVLPCSSLLIPTTMHTYDNSQTLDR